VTASTIPAAPKTTNRRRARFTGLPLAGDRVFIAPIAVERVPCPRWMSARPRKNRQGDKDNAGRPRAESTVRQGPRVRRGPSVENP
jgi:hypothetical protein